MSNPRSARRTWLHLACSVAVVAAVTALAPAAVASQPPPPPPPPPPPTATPAYEVHGTVYVPTSAAAVVRCPDTTVALQGMAGWLVKGVTPGRVFSLRAEDASYRNDFDVRFYSSQAACVAGAAPLPHTNRAGDEQGVVPAGASVAAVTLATGTPAAFTYAELPADPFRRRVGRAGVTVVAVIEQGTGNDGKHNGFGVYHDDFLGSYHPWNLDQDTTNDIDFRQAPSTYIPGMPAETALPITLPSSENDNVASLSATDAAMWAGMRAHTDAEPNLYWLPGTKVVAAAEFGSMTGGDIHGDNDTHATGSASVAAGNIHGTCPECVFVLLNGSPGLALAWATKQPWIDVVTNSWLSLNTSPADTGLTSGSEYLDTKRATVDGQTVFWGAGNGVANSQMAAPASLTYDSSQRGPDWVVTVGGISEVTDQPYGGSGRPADIASYAAHYPSAGGPTVSSVGYHAGTSNSSPVVAGTFARIVSLGRQLLGDTTPGHADGVVATGTAVPCAVSSVAPCPLADGVLSRAEAQALLFDNVVPNPADATPNYVDQGDTQPTGATVLDTAFSGPMTEMRPATEGHGIVYGRMDASRFVAEQRRFSDALQGAVYPYPRPPEEAAWMTVDSKCRQQLWGQWYGGAYTVGHEPVFSLPTDASAAALHAVCSQLPPDFFIRVGPLVNADGLSTKL